MIDVPDRMLPCPFCGEPGEVVPRTSAAAGYNYAAVARCTECHQAVLGKTWEAAREGAIEAWNQRVKP